MNALLEAQRKRVGRRIRAARVSAGLTHDQLGAKVGTSRQHLIKLEKGQHLPGETMLARIAEATGKPESFFAADEDEEAEPVSLDEFLTRRIDKLVEARLAQSNDPAARIPASTAGSQRNGG